MMISMDEYHAIGSYLEDSGFSNSYIDDYFEHHGVKGMRWGVRSAKSVGRGVAATGKAIGRGAKATGKFAWNHKKAAASVIVGITAVSIIISRRGKLAPSKLPIPTVEQRKATDLLINKHNLDRIDEVTRHADMARRAKKLSDIQRGTELGRKPAINDPFGGILVNRIKSSAAGHKIPRSDEEIIRALASTTDSIIAETNRRLGLG